MAHKDFVQPVKKVKKELTFDFSELYSMIKGWLGDRGYACAEMDHYDVSLPGGGRKIDISLACEKKVDPYIKLIMEIGISSSFQDVTVEQDGKKTTAQQGSVDIAFGGYLKTDSENDWKVKNKSIILTFFRDVYDKYFGNSKLESAESKLQSDLKKIIYDLKTYLKLHRFD